jgi:hypothetical protein
MYKLIQVINIVKNSINYNKKLKILDSFLSPHYQQHNVARLCHLESLGLDLNNKKVLEFGAGIGDHTVYYLFKNCNVLPTDARPELVEIIKNRFGIRAEVLNAENDLQKLEGFEYFDVIHCYGVLYHLNNPDKFINSISSIGNILLLETCVSPDHLPVNVYYIKENHKNITQAVSGIGCRPSRKWIENELKKNYEFVYYPKTQPDHLEFPLNWNNLPEKSLIRAIFIASHAEINNSNLTTEIPLEYEKIKCHQSSSVPPEPRVYI